MRVLSLAWTAAPARARCEGTLMTLDLGTADQLRTALATVAAIPVTPFGPDGHADWDAHDRVIRRMVDAGIRLVTPNENTGEFYALPATEALRSTESAVAAAA